MEHKHDPRVTDPKLLAVLTELADVCRKHGAALSGQFTVWLEERPGSSGPEECPLPDDEVVGVTDVSMVNRWGSELWSGSVGEVTADPKTGNPVAKKV